MDGQKDEGKKSLHFSLKRGGGGGAITQHARKYGKFSNKSTAGMQHTPPQDIFNAKKIILKLDLFMQSLQKIGKEMPKIESEKPVYNVNQGP